MGGDESNSRKNEQESERIDFTRIINLLYDELLKFGYLYKDLYDMTIKELENTLTQRKQGLAYEIWRLASLTRSPFVKNFPNSPKEACKELFPQEQGIPMPDFLIKKAMKRGVM